MTKPHSGSNASRRTSLKTLAEHLHLSPSTISYVLNDSPGRSIPEATRARIRAAAQEFNYQPSMIARKLQGKRMQTVGVLLPELGEGYHSQVLSGIGDYLLQNDFFYFTVHHRHRQHLVATYPELLRSRGVDGILAIDTRLPDDSLPVLPTVLVAGHTNAPGVTNVILNHQRAAELSLGHLYDLGHRKIAFMQGQPFSSDSGLRWEATLQAARQFGIEVNDELTVHLEIDSFSPAISYPGIRRLIQGHRPFTAVLCFNDVSAMGTVRALHEGGLRVPQDVSVLGFDDIQSAEFQVPSLTTIRQPLQQMGSTAAEMLLRKLHGEPTPDLIRVDPALIVRESTGPAPARSVKKRSPSSLHPGNLNI